MKIFNKFLAGKIAVVSDVVSPDMKLKFDEQGIAEVTEEGFAELITIPHFEGVEEPVIEDDFAPILEEEKKEEAKQTKTKKGK